MMHRTLRAAGLAALAAAGLAACGTASGSQPNIPAGGHTGIVPAAQRSRLLAKVADPPSSFQMSLVMSMSGIPVHAGATTSETVSEVGVFDPRTKLGAMTVRISGPARSGGGTFGGRAILDGRTGTIYVDLSQASQIFGKRWLGMSLNSLGSSELSGTSLNPSETLSQLAKLGGTLRRLGEQAYHGVPTTAYLLTTTWSHLIAAGPLSGRLPASVAATLDASGPLQFHLFIDSQGRLRGEQVHLTGLGTIVKAVLESLGRPVGRAVTSELSGMQMSLSLSVSAYGVPVQVSVPPASQVKMMTVPSLFGGTASGGGASSPGLGTGL